MGKLVFKKKKDGDIVILTIGGAIDTGVLPQLESKIKKAIAAGGKKFIGDLSSLEYLTSSGIGMLIAIKNLVKSKGGDIKLACVNSKIMKVFSLLNLNKLIQIVPTVEDARKAFKE